MKVAVIGAGCAGLVSAKHVTTAGLECDVFETTGNIGGVWVYNEKFENNDYGYKVCAPMYPGLVTNLPKEVMNFPDLAPESDQSFLTVAEVHTFLTKYAEKFDLKKLVKLIRHVENISLINNEKWEVKSVDKITKKVFADVYDGVMVCCGIYNSPIIPTLKGQEKFKGNIAHSYTFRNSKDFKDKRVLIIGASASGMDMVHQIHKDAKMIVVSHHFTFITPTFNIENVIVKPDVTEIIGETEVKFADGQVENIDAILLCTGYKYNYPFLNKNSEIQVDDKYVYPLYKHMFNANHPSMCLVGIPFQVCAFRMFDLQAKVFVKALKGLIDLPTCEERLKDVEDEKNARLAQGYTMTQMHAMYKCQQEYYDDIAQLGQVESIPPVIPKMFNDCALGIFNNISGMRKYNYIVKDKDTFEKIPLDVTI